MTLSEAPAPVVVDGTGTGTADRPQVDPAVLAVIAAAVDQAWPRPPIVVVEEARRAPAWRFSGRWWSRPATTRRERPWAGS